MSKVRLAIIGNGMVGHRFIEDLLDKSDAANFDITVFCEEPRIAYDRVHLSSYFSHHTAEELSQLLDAFSDCMDALENYDEHQDESAQAVKLDQYMHIAEQINELRNEFAAAGTDEADVLALLGKISASESKIQLASLSAQREKALADCTAFCDNVSRAYQN